MLFRRVHTGEQAHPCVSCGEGFLTKAELHQHVRAAHNGVNPNTSSATIIANQQVCMKTLIYMNLVNLRYIL